MNCEEDGVGENKQRQGDRKREREKREGGKREKAGEIKVTEKEQRKG